MPQVIPAAAAAWAGSAVPAAWGAFAVFAVQVTAPAVGAICIKGRNGVLFIR